jgi:hypothetical protein
LTTKKWPGGGAAEPRVQNRTKRHTLNTKIADPRQARYAITDGRDALGTVQVAGGFFIAVDITGIVIGTFATLREAARAFHVGGWASSQIARSSR